jgi:hypothetical protein
MGVIDPLFKQSEIEVVKSLWDDPECRRGIIREESKRILKEDKPIFSHPQEQIMAMVYQADFSCSDDECVFVAGAIIKNIKSANIFPQLEELFTDFVFHPERSNYTSMNFASKCLVSTSLFYKRMERVHQRYSAPPPEYYVTVGKKAFEIIGKPELSQHFDNWRSHISEFFCV